MEPSPFAFLPTMQATILPQFFDERMQVVGGDQPALSDADSFQASAIDQLVQRPATDPQYRSCLLDGEQSGLLVIPRGGCASWCCVHRRFLLSGYQRRLDARGYRVESSGLLPDISPGTGSSL